MTKHLAWLILGVLAGAGCRSTQKPTAKSPIGPLPAGSFARAWAAPLDLTNDASREINLTSDRVFAYTRQNQSYVISRAGGTLRFFNNVDVNGGVLRAPIILKPYIIYPTSSSLEVYSDAGRLLKSIALDSPTGASGVGDGNMVYIGENPQGGYGRVVAIDITRPVGVPSWSVLTRGTVLGQPALYDKVIFCGSDDGSLVALTEDGTAAWPMLPDNVFKAGGGFVSDIVADETGVYAASTDTKLYVLNRETGKIEWQYYSMRALKTPPAVTKTMVYQWVPGTGLAGLDKLHGGYNRVPKWIVPDAVQFLSEDENHAYLRRDDNTILAVDKHTGKVLFESKGKAFDVFATNTTDSRIFAATADGLVVAIRPVLSAGETGEIVMRLAPAGLSVREGRLERFASVR